VYNHFHCTTKLDFLWNELEPLFISYQVKSSQVRGTRAPAERRLWEILCIDLRAYI